MATTWTIAIDWDRNNDYSGTYDDVTARTLSVQWFLGMRRPYQTTADDSMLTLVLDNVDKRFSPEYSGSPLAGKVVPFRKVRIRSDDGTTVRTHWVGWIESIEPSVDVNGRRTVEIRAAGPMQFFKASETALELQENMRTDQIIAELIKEVVIPPALSEAWVLGRVGNSEVGQTTYLANTTSYSELDQGTVTLAIAGDNWVRRGGLSSEVQDTFDVYRAIWDVTAAERGRFLFDRVGKAVFWNETHLSNITQDDASFNDTMHNLQYVYADPLDFQNEIVVMCHPRSISATSDEVLWDLQDEITVPAGETRKLYAKYEDETGYRIGGKDVTAQNITFSSGTATVTVNPRANSAEVVIDNTGGGSNAVLNGLTLKGTKITDKGRMEAVASSPGSIVDYGRRTLKFNLPAVDNYARAEAIAALELDRRKDPRGWVRRLDLRSHGQDGGEHHAHQLSLTLGNRIAVQESQTEHNASYYIIGEGHRLTDSATLLETSWYLEPVSLS